MQATTNSLDKYVSQDNKHIKHIKRKGEHRFSKGLIIKPKNFSNSF